MRYLGRIFLFLILLVFTLKFNVWADDLVDDFYNEINVSNCDSGIRDCSGKALYYYYSSYISDEDLVVYSALDHVVLLSNIGKTFTAGKTELVVFICDSSFESLDFKCDSQKVTTSASDNSVVKGTSEIGIYKSTKPLLIVVPESYFVDATHRSEIASIFRALTNSEIPASSNLDSGTRLGVGSLKRELIIFAIITLIFVVALVKAPKGKFTLNNLSSIYKSLVDFFAKNNEIALYVLILGSITYVLLMSLISYIDTGSLDFLYMLSYATEVSSLSLLPEFIDQGQLLKLLLFFYNFTMLITFLLYIVPELSKLQIWKRNPEDTSSINFKIQLPLSLLLLALIFYVCAFGLRINFWIIFILMFIGYISLKTNSFTDFSKLEKFFMSIVLAICLGLGAIVRIYVPQLRHPSNLVSIASDANSGLVGLPIELDIEDDTEVESLNVRVDKDLYLNNYLLFSKDNYVVTNSPIKNFDSSKPYRINVVSYSDFLPEFEINNNLKSQLKTALPSILSSTEIDVRGIHTLQIDLKCIGNTKGGLLEVRNFVVEDIGVKRRNDKELSLPACTLGSKKELKYSVDIDLPESKIYFVVLPPLGYEIENVALYRVQNSIPLEFYDTSKSHLDTSTEMYIYSDSYDSEFKTTRVSDTVDIAEPINALISQRLVKGEVSITSPEGILLMLKE